MKKLTRRKFIVDSTTMAAGSVMAAQFSPALLAAAEAPKDFQSDWHRCADRVWLGPEYWANPLQDWRLSGGRIECVHAAPNRNVHLLTRQLADRDGSFQMSVRLGLAGGAVLSKAEGSAGLRIGIKGPLGDYRNSLLYGGGLNAGITSAGGLFIGNPQSAKESELDPNIQMVELRLTAEPNGNAYTVTLQARDVLHNKSLGEVTRRNVPAAQLVGNVALVANFGPSRRARGQAQDQTGFGKFWFSDWHVSGSKVEARDEQTFGPILFSQYTLSQGVLKLTAQMPPLGTQDEHTVRLQTGSGGRNWKTISEALIHPDARTATFRVDDWDGTKDMPYRLAYTMKFNDGGAEEHFWAGTIRRDPVDDAELTVADVSCNAHYAFPNNQYVAHMAKLNPDLLAFTGDQFYEPSGGYGVQRTPVEPAILDLLRKWYLHGWTWRELTRDRPSISIPDDHDVYQGNIWGEAGAPRHGTQEMGGYDMPARWVNVVHRTQTSHHPDPSSAGPIRQLISVYYGPLVYGRVSFAIIADRQFKSGPEGKVPPTGNRGDHVVDPKFDPKTADVPGLELLGDGQIAFLREWAADWHGADMKAVVSQTIFTAMATTHGPKRERLVADYDANGWPQSARNRALREIRKGFAFHLAGDQHLPAVVHYGVDEHGDAGVALASPAVNNLYPRWFEPEKPGANRKPEAPENTGDFLDCFGNPMTVLAVQNPLLEFRKGVLETEQDKASGLSVVRFDKRNQRVIVECWPFLADPKKDKQFSGWPVTVDMMDNYGRKPAAHLPKLEVSGVKNPVVQVINEADGEVVYTLRVAGRSFQPHVFAPGKYTVKVSEPDSGRSKELPGLEATPENKTVMKVKV